MDSNIQKPAEKTKNRRWWFAGILIVCLIVAYLFFGIVFVMAFGDPPKDMKKFSYHVIIDNRQLLLTPGSEILIPAVVDGNNSPVFPKRNWLP